MGQRRGLIDSNVLIALFEPEHKHHDSSFAFLNERLDGEFATSLHCFSEFYSSVTRGALSGGLASTPARAIFGIDSFKIKFEVLALTPPQHFDALTSFACDGHVGPRVYDFLIGQIAVVHAIPLIVTWNVKHFAPLFPTLRVATPAELLQET